MKTTWMAIILLTTSHSARKLRQTPHILQKNLLNSIPALKTFKFFFSTSLASSLPCFFLSLSLWNGYLKLPALSGMPGTHTQLARQSSNEAGLKRATTSILQ